MKKNLSQLFDDAAPQELEQLLSDAQAPALPQDTIVNIQKKVQTATGLQKKKNFPIRKFAAVAACLALMAGLMALAFGGSGVVTSPGILTVMAYGADQNIVYITSPDIVEHKAICSSSPDRGWQYGNPFTLNVSGEQNEWQNVYFSVLCDGGRITIKDEDGYHTVSTPYTAQNGETIYWHHADDEWNIKPIVYIDIIIYSEDQIVGYTVLQLRMATCEDIAEEYSLEVSHEGFEPDGEIRTDVFHCEGGDHLVDYMFKVEKLASVFFPKVHGEYQNISEEYLLERIKEVKSSK